MTVVMFIALIILFAGVLSFNGWAILLGLILLVIVSAG